MNIKINNILKLGRNNKFNITSIDSMPQYSYNWPYDFFSLVELAKINVQVKYENNEDNAIVSISDKSVVATKDLKNLKIRG